MDWLKESIKLIEKAENLVNEDKSPESELKKEIDKLIAEFFDSVDEVKGIFKSKYRYTNIDECMIILEIALKSLDKAETKARQLEKLTKSK